ncbi:aspartyl-phosphate phosphatase Spo0E family protein [Bacillus sp. OTU530]|uniref:aspartyl-phosphate phosphatase Spo0E family protein n=1 Tax=Bacillus sp. OTU530 TaxID=3043862 RepID=UPI00313D12A8
MILRNALELSKGIENDRLDMYELAKNKGFSNPEVLNMSQQLDKKITLLQEMMLAIRSKNTKMSHYQVH